MTLAELYEAAIAVGMSTDLRGRDALEAHLRDVQSRFQELPEPKQRLFDRERLRNPFGDTRIANGPRDVELRRVMLGVDIDRPELLLSAELTRCGKLT